MRGSLLFDVPLTSEYFHSYFNESTQKYCSQKSKWEQLLETKQSQWAMTDNIPLENVEIQFIIACKPINYKSTHNKPKTVNIPLAKR